MKKAKVLIAALLSSGLVLSGCTFEEGLEMAKSWANNNVAQPVVNFWNEKILGKKPSEEQKEEKEEKQDEGEKPAPAAQLTSISISGQYKTEYEVGESFDSTGIVVTAAYDDGTEQDVSSQAIFSGFSSEQAGPCTVTVSFEGQTATFDVTINPAVKRDWTAEEKAIFADHLHGEVLPFFPIEGATPFYDATEDNIRIFDAQGNRLAVSGTDIPDYAALYSANNGWEDVSNQYTAYSSAPTGSFWVFEKSVDTADGMRRLSVQFFGASGNSYALSGEFYFFASDPFNYDFPAEEIAQVFAGLNLPAFSIPEPDGNGLFYEFNPDPENADWLAAGYTSYVYDQLYIYGLGSEGFANYIAKFEAAGWQASVSSSTYTLTKEFNEGIAKVLTADAGDYVIVRIYYVMDPLPTTEWPTEGAAALVQAVVPGSNTVIPAFTSSDITNIEVDESFNEIDVYGPESLKAEYAALLKEEGWADGSAADYYVSPNGDVQVRLVYSSTYGLRIIISAVPVWPAAAVAAVIENLVSGSETVVPALDGGTKYNWWSSTELDVYGDGQTLGATFAASLKTAGWTEIDDNLYLSPAEDITIEIVAKTSYVEIYFAKYIAPAPVWPADAVAAFLGSGITDTVPAYEGEASKFQFVEGGYVVITVGEGNEASAVETYQAALAQANYSEYGPDGYGDMQYLSEHNQILVCAYVSNNAGEIVISFRESPVSSTFPVDKVNAFLTQAGFGFQVTADMFANLNVSSYEFYSGLYYGVYPYIDITMPGSHADELDAILGPLAEAAGFEYDADYGAYYAADNSYVAIWEEDGNTYIEMQSYTAVD